MQLPSRYRYEGRKRVHIADEYMASIAAERVFRYLLEPLS
jgi:hypothetical protein